MSSVSSIFDSFNARALNAIDVAKTFVPSQQFDALVKRRHTIVLGPRGSGKTTLLKMLQTQALEHWHHPLAQTYREQVDFTGVFIATDISWGEQIAALGNRHLDADSHRQLSIATFTTHVLRALVMSMLDRLDPALSGNGFRRVHLPIDAENHLTRELCRAWKIEVEVPTLLALKHALSFRLGAIRELASKEVLLGLEGRLARLSEIDSLHLHFVQSCSLAIELFDDLTNEQGSKWALMFDELELAPRWIQDELVQALRSTDGRLLFKLALNPYSESELLLSGPLSAAPGQDFDQIPLWYAEKRDAFEFCTNLWYQMLDLRKMPQRDPQKVLGNSYFETSASDWEGQRNAYNITSRIGSRFAELADKDSSFRLYLQNSGIDLESMHLLKGDERAATVRKIAPIVALREFYRRADREGGNRGGERSRKRAVLYSGADSLFAISEGNPRWFIGIVSKLFDRWDVATNPRIPPAIQAQEQQKAAERFAAMLKTLPTPNNQEGGPLGAYEIVKHAAKYFRKEAVSSDFRAEPPGTFIVDDRVDAEILPSLKQALNSGALVYVPDDDGQLILTSLRHKRFRIAYLLAPLYGIPIRLGKAIALSAILQGRQMRVRRPQVPRTAELFIFDEDRNDAQ
jgi:hypothetical protein